MKVSWLRFAARPNVQEVVYAVETARDVKMMNNNEVTATTPTQIVDSNRDVLLLDALSRDYIPARCNLSIDIVSGSRAGHKWKLMILTIAICSD